MKEYTVYILECSDETLYTGITTDVGRRLREHNGEISGGAKYTQHRRPSRIVYSEQVPSRSDASKREWVLKGLTRKEKLHLISAYSQSATNKKPSA